MTVVPDQIRLNQAGITVVLDGHSLKLEDVVAVARHRQPVALHNDAITRINRCRDLLERKIRAREIMYGVNTGIGELSEVVLTPEQAEKFQKFLLYSHAAGCGEPCAEEDVRAGMLSRLNTQIEMLNRGVTPVVCQKGSVGACGDLSPMAQMAITLMGEGEVFYQGKKIPAKQGLSEAGREIELIFPVFYHGIAASNSMRSLRAQPELRRWRYTARRSPRELQVW